MKRRYRRPETEMLSLESETGVLIGSTEGPLVEIKEVTVQPFEDGFAEEGGFREINFD